MRPPACEICDTNQWTEAYRGRVRDGVFGSYRENSAVYRCGGCGVERLAEDACIPDSFYATADYRAKLKQGLDSDSYFVGHDEQAIFAMQTVWPENLRQKTVADVGCAGGSLLDHLRGVTRRQIGIEPSDLYRATLESRGYAVYPYAADATADWAGRVDLAFSIQVIEHTKDPVRFLTDIRPLLSAGGRLVISTPNRRDILFDLLPEDFPPFFYRVVHRWYFDASSLTACSRKAGFEVAEIRHVHRYGLGNAMRWMRDRRPTGNAPLNGVDRAADGVWASHLESTGRSDVIYLVLRAQ